MGTFSLMGSLEVEDVKMGLTICSLHLIVMSVYILLIIPLPLKY